MRLVTDEEPRARVVLKEAESPGEPEVTSDPAVALAFANAIAKPGTKALLLDSNNAPQVTEDGKPKRVSLQEAVGSGFAYAIQPRSRLLVLDIDKPEHHEWASLVTDRAGEAGWAVVRVASGGDSHRFHLWIIFPPGWGHRETKRWALENGAVGEAVRADDGQMVRPPGSPHRSGFGRATVVGTGSAQALRTFRSAVDDEQLPELAVRQLWGDPSTMKRAYGKPSRGVTLYSTALAAVNAGWEFDQWLRELEKPGNETASKYREMGVQQGHTWALKCWDNARKWVRENPPVGSAAAARAKVERLRNRTDLEWRGQTGGTDRAVYLAVLEVAHMVGTLTPSASGRQLAELANVMPRTVWRSVERLEARGLIRRTKRVTAEHGTTVWAVVPPIEGADSPLPREEETSVDEPISCPLMGGQGLLLVSTGALLDDIFVNGAGLGISTRATWEALTSEPQTADEVLARRPSGPSKKTVLKHLNKLRDNGFAARQGNRWTRIDPTEADLQERALWLGVKGKNAHRKDLHDRERKQYRQRFQHKD